MPLCSWISVTLMSAAGFPVVRSVTVPWSVPARAQTMGTTVRTSNRAKRRKTRLITSLEMFPKDAGHAVAVLEIRSPGQFPPAAWPLHSPKPFSSLGNHLRNIFRNETQSVGLEDYRRWYRGVPSIDPVVNGAAQDRKHLAECRR